MSADPATHAATGYDVLIALITTLGPIAFTLATWWASRARQDKHTKDITAQVEAKADEVARIAEASVVRTAEGNAQIAEVHKVVNGKNDALVSENQRLAGALATAQAELANRRVADTTPPSM